MIDPTAPLILADPVASLNGQIYGSNLIPAGAVYDDFNSYTLTGLTVGATYSLTLGAADQALRNGAQTLLASGTFTAQGVSVVLAAILPDTSVTASVKQVIFLTGLTGGDYYLWTPGANEASVLALNSQAVLAENVAGMPVIFQVPAAETALQFLGVEGMPWTGKLQLIGGLKTNQANAGSYVTITSTTGADILGDQKIQLKVTWRDPVDRYVITGNLPIVLNPTDGSGFVEIESVFKPVTAGSIQAILTCTVLGVAFTKILGTLGPSDLRSPSFQRVRIFPIPLKPGSLNVLGKKPFVPLDFGSEVPALRNLDNVLIAFATADMLTRQRQFGKAQSQMTEAVSLLHELALLEAMQAASNTQFIPESGYGDGYFNPRGGSFGEGF
jgi:hypothetical protein